VAVLRVSGLEPTTIQSRVALERGRRDGSLFVVTSPLHNQMSGRLNPPIYHEFHAKVAHVNLLRCGRDKERSLYLVTK